MKQVQDIEFGGQTLRVHFDYERARAATQIDPPEPAEFSITQIDLVVEITEDLSPQPNAKRRLPIDITEMVDTLGEEAGLTILAELELSFEEYDPREDEPTDQLEDDLRFEGDLDDE